MPRTTTFRIAAKKFFITYPQCPVTKDELKTHLNSFGGGLSNYCICTEKHQDGSPHLHALVSFNDKIDVRSPHYFDLTNQNQNYHPSIEPVRNWSASLRYVMKDGDYISGGSDEDFWLSVEQSTSVTDFMGKWLRRKPKEYWLNYDKLYSAAEKHFIRHDVGQYTPVFAKDSFILPQAITDWYNSNLANSEVHRPKSLVLIGASRTGKTEWARSLGSHCYFGAEWNLDSYFAQADYFVFDDVPWERFKFNWKSWLGCQRDFTVTDKYKSKRRVSGGKPTIFLCNRDNDPALFLSQSEKEWYFENVCIVVINNKLY